MERAAAALVTSAETAARRGRTDEALLLFQEALKTYMDAYKAEANEAEKCRLLATIEIHMAQAEKLKALPPAAPPVPAKSSAARVPHSNAVAPRTPMAALTKPPAKPRNTQPSDEYASQIIADIMEPSSEVRWSDIAGLEFAKQTLQETVVLPNLRPDLFSGLRSPPKGVLMFGPPGTGKTLLAKAVATESGFAFFPISAASVTSKYHGDGEKLVRALFSVAKQRQPAVIFIDEIDALLSARQEGEHEASRRIKTEFMTQLDGATTNESDRILIMGATNLPWEIDEAVIRRMTKRIYIPLPDKDARKALIVHMLTKQGPSSSSITASQLNKIVSATEGYSGSDIKAVCQEAALGPLRELSPDKLRSIQSADVRSICDKDFMNALKVIRSSVAPDRLRAFDTWASRFAASR